MAQPMMHLLIADRIMLMTSANYSLTGAVREKGSESKRPLYIKPSLKARGIYNGLIC